uniref:ADP/ATP translocase n=1 Tax=Panagrolaimus sp. ES5 TaxID=591445 RepID=A0AC34FWA6_9BILA
MSSIASTSHSSDWRHLAKGCTAGGAAAVISKTALAPVDRLKLVLQLQNAQVYLAKQKYSGLVDCLVKIKSEQGILSLWRGNSASIARCFPSYALNFAFRDYFRLLFLGGVDKKKEHGRFVLGNIAAGGAGGATTLCICYPLDFARTRLAVDSKKDGSQRFKGMNDCLKKIYSKDGIRGLYRGFVVSLQFIVVSRAVFFGLFDTIRLTAVDDSKKLSFFSLWCLAQTCIVTSSIMCYPLDTVRRRLMMESGKKEKLYSGSIDCWQKIMRQEGMNGFFRGAMTNSLKTTSGALVLAIYYEVLKYI